MNDLIQSIGHWMLGTILIYVVLLCVVWIMLTCWLAGCAAKRKRVVL